MELPNEDSLRWIVTRYAKLRAAADSAFDGADLIEPNGDYFPDAFAPSAEAVATLLKRTLSYAPVADDLAIELAFVEADQNAASAKSCSSGGCGSSGEGLPLGNAFETDDGYRVVVRVTDVGEPTLLVASLARSAGAIILGEAGEEPEAAADATEAWGAASEIAAVASGFGLLLLNGSCVYKKGCGGLRAHEGTHLSVSELAVATSLFLRVHGIKPSRVRSHLETTQREAFDEAMRWVDGNDAVVRALREDPARLEDGAFKLGAPRGLLGRLFAKGEPDETKAEAELRRVAAAARARVRSDAEQRKIAETKALVERALSEGDAPAE